VSEPDPVIEPEPEPEPVIETPAAPAPAPVPGSEESFVTDSVPDPRSVLQDIKDAGVPILNIGEQEIPFTSNGHPHTWALVNLILAIAGIILAGVTALRVIAHKRQEREDEETMAMTEEERQYKKTRLGWIITAIAMGAAGIIVFLLTQNMDYLMVLIDHWTIVNAVIFIVEIVGYTFSFKKKKDRSDEDTNINFRSRRLA